MLQKNHVRLKIPLFYMKAEEIVSESISRKEIQLRTESTNLSDNFIEDIKRSLVLKTIRRAYCYSAMDSST